MFKEFWGKLSTSFKTNTTSFIAIIIGIVFITFLILPQEKDTDKKIASKYVELAQNYDAKTEQYTNLQEALKLQTQISEMQTTSKTTKLLRTAVVSLMLTGLIGLLATLLQYIYTGLPFIKKKFTGDDGIVSDAERGDAMIVLAAALISATIIVMTVYCITFLG